MTVFYCARCNRLDEKQDARGHRCATNKAVKVTSRKRVKRKVRRKGA